MRTNTRRLSPLVLIAALLGAVGLMSGCTEPPANPTITYTRATTSPATGDYLHWSKAPDGSTESVWITSSGIAETRALLATCGDNTACMQTFRQAAFVDQAGADQAADRMAFFNGVANDPVEFARFRQVMTSNPVPGCARIVFTFTTGQKPNTVTQPTLAGTRTNAYTSCPGPSAITAQVRAQNAQFAVAG